MNERQKLTKRPHPITLLWNPFYRIAGLSSLVTGLIIILLTGWIGSFSNAHFDGVLDTHIGSSAPLWFFLCQGIVNWLTLTVCLWIGGLILAGPGQFRAIDLLGTQALARWPFFLTACLTIFPGFTSYTQKLVRAAQSGNLLALPEAPAGEVITFWSVSLGMLVMLIWFITLAWQSFRISCGVKGWKAVVTFVVALILAEAISIVAIRVGLAGFL